MVTPEDKQLRVFKTPLIVPLLVVMVITIYAGYIFFYSTNKETAFLVYLKGISFEVFILCNFGMLSLILYNKKQLDEFLYSFPIINNRNGLETLKPIVRTNMYSSLFMILFLAIGSLTAIMSILNHGLVKGVLVAVLSIATAKAINWYNPSEQKIKHIQCVDESLEVELNQILQCWMHKPFPNF
ncbi:MAG: hypothetical protein HQK63_16470 [Desulfamplus sp.]|nr:hypothetical protein [Desulfamplus sp.]